MQINPTQAMKLMRPRVRMLDNKKPVMAATPTKTAVHVPCEDTAFRPIEMPSIPDPATNIQTVNMLELPCSTRHEINMRLAVTATIT
jgi:hypothetical protein